MARSKIVRSSLALWARVKLLARFKSVRSSFKRWLRVKLSERPNTGRAHHRAAHAARPIRERLIRALAGGTVLCVLLTACGFYGTCAGVRDRVVRLHILANSDSPADQQLKLAVRDAVTEAAAGFLDAAQSTDEALLLAESALPFLEQTATDAVREEGYGYPVKATLCRMYFTTRQYGDITLPAGMYDAVRLTIGAGEGHNWWCVVYPTLCLGCAVRDDALGDALSPGQQKLVRDTRVTVRFKLVEWAEGLLRLLRR